MANLPRVTLPVDQILQPLLLLLAASLPFTASPAEAQTVVNIKRDQLEQVKPYNAPRQVYILDENPKVKDLRRAPENSPTYGINIAPLPGVKGQPGVIMLTPERSSLPQSGFQSQIPAGGMIKPKLPGTTMGGHAPIDRVPGAPSAQSARPVGLKSVQALRTGKPTTTTPATYTPYQTNGGGFDGRFAQHVQTKATGSLINHK